MRWPAFSSLAAAVLLAACVSTRPTPLTGPHMPLIVPGFCSGEDCEFHYQAIACRAFDLRDGDSSRAGVINHIGRRDTVFVENGSLRVTAPGVVVIKRDLVLTTDVGMDDRPFARDDTLTFARGDTLYLLHYNALDDWEWWVRGHETRGQRFWFHPDKPNMGLGANSADSTTAVARSYPVVEQWLFMRPRTGSPGWVKERSNFIASLNPDDGGCPK
jgi:hypothetical protein